MYQLMSTTNGKTTYYYILDTSRDLRTPAINNLPTLIIRNYPCDSRDNLVAPFWKSTLLDSADNLHYFRPNNFPELFI